MYYSLVSLGLRLVLVNIALLKQNSG